MVRLRSSLLLGLLALALSGFQAAPDKAPAASPPARPKPAARPTPAPAPVLQGTVKGPDGKPVEKALVAVAIRPAGQIMFRPESPLTTHTDATGSFRIALKNAGAHTVRVEAAGLASQTLERVQPGSPLVVTLQKGGVIQGVVKDGTTGQPLPRARVQAWDSGGITLLWEPGTGRVESVADAKGRFRIEGLASGLQTVSAGAAGFGRAQRRNVKLGSTIELFLFPGSSLTGTVWGPGNVPVAGAVVRLEPEGMRFSSGAMQVEASDTQGRFEILGIEPGSYRLVVRHPDYAPALVAGITVEPQSEAHADAVLEKGSTIVGRLVDVDRPVAGRVSVTEVDGKDASLALQELLRAEAGADGRFRIETVPPGSHALSVRAPGFAAKRVDATVGVSPVTDLGDVALESGLTIRGRVRDKAGNPIVDASIRGWSGRMMPESNAETRSEPDGRFVLGGLSPGSYELMAEAPGFGMLRRPADAGAEGVDLVLAAAGTITGQVVDDAGQPIPAFQVMARPVTTEGPGMRFMSMPRFKQVVENDGRFALEDVAEGTYVVTATAPEKNTGIVSDVKIAPGGTTDVGRVKLGAGGAIRGSVVDPAGAGIPGASVSVQGAGRDFMSFGNDPGTVTDGAGAFEIKGAPLGSVELSATHPNFAPGRQAGIEVDPARGPAEARIVLSQGGRLEGAVRKRDGSGIPNTMVQVTEAMPGGFRMMSGRGPNMVPTQADGSFVFEHLPPGRMRVMVMSGGGGRFTSGQNREVDVREGQTTAVEFVSREILVTGRVTRSGAPGAGLHLRVSSRSGFGVGMMMSGGGDATPAAVAGPQRMTATTREDGSYEMLVDDPGAATVSAESADGRVRLPSRSVDFPDADAFTLDLEYTGAVVTGIVVDKETEQGIPRAAVFASPLKAEGSRPGGGVASAESGPDGRFQLELDPGDYRVRADARDGDYGRGEVEASVGSAGGPEIRIPLARGLVIAGRVVDQGGRPVGGIGVSASAEEGGGAASSGGFAQSLPDGTFRLGGLHAGSHTVIASSNLGHFGMKSSVTPGDKQVVLTLRPGGRVRVQVTNPAGAPVEGAWAFAERVNGSRVGAMSSRTDAQGIAEIAVPAGSVELRVNKEGGLEGRVTVGVNPDTVVPAQVQLAPRQRQSQ